MKEAQQLAAIYELAEKIYKKKKVIPWTEAIAEALLAQTQQESVATELLCKAKQLAHIGPVMEEHEAKCPARISDDCICSLKCDTQIPTSWQQGVRAAAKLIDDKAVAYAHHFGSEDMGGLSFGKGASAEVKRDHHSNMIELAEELRLMASNGFEKMGGSPKTY